MKRSRLHIPGWSWLRWSQWIGVLVALLSGCVAALVAVNGFGRPRRGGGRGVAA